MDQRSISGRCRRSLRWYTFDATVTIAMFCSPDVYGYRNNVFQNSGRRNRTDHLIHLDVTVALFSVNENYRHPNAPGHDHARGTVIVNEFRAVLNDGSGRKVLISCRIAHIKSLNVNTMPSINMSDRR